jgi:hypothetical protein
MLDSRDGSAILVWDRAVVGLKRNVPVKNACKAARVVACCAAMSACVTMQWVFSRQGPVVPELGAVRTLGIAVFDPVLKSNDHLLIRVGGPLYNPVDLDGVTRKVALVALAPEAASKFAVNRDVLARMCLDVWEREIGTAHRFDYAVSNGLTLTRILGQGAEGDPIPTGYDAVRAVPERLNRQGASEAAIGDICLRYAVDALLVVEPSVYAEVGQVSSLQSAHAIGKEIEPGNFILRAQVAYQYVLFDGKSGTAITDSTRSKPQYDTRQPPETWIIDLGPSSPQSIIGFLNSPRYVKLFPQPMQEALKPYLTLFRTCAVAVFGK